LAGAQDTLKYTEAIIYSMTPFERRKPKLINGSRRLRIAKGSGTDVQDVNRLLKDFEKMQKDMKKMMKLMKGNKMGMPGMRKPMPPMPGMPPR
jgi:signal recognition particle subunit SRP54